MDLLAKHALIDLIEDYSFVISQEQITYKSFHKHLHSNLNCDSKERKYTYPEVHLEEDATVRDCLQRQIVD